MVHIAKQAVTAPTFPISPFKMMAAMRQNPLTLLEAAQTRYGDMVRFKIGPRIVHLVSHPDHIQHVLQTNHQNYRKGRGLMRARPLLGDGLLTNHGDSWLSQRRLMQPAFHRQQLANLARVMTDCAGDTLTEWQGRAIQGQSFDVAEEMMHLTLRIVGKALFSLDVSHQAEFVGDALERVLTEAIERILHPAILDYLPLPSNRRFRQAIADLDKVVFEIIETRRQNPLDQSDLLGTLMQARDEDTGEGMNNRQLRDEVMTLFLAGHETTANALAWTWYLLAQNPASFAALHVELKTVLNGRLPALTDLPNLPYTRMVIDEALRLYPPAWAIVRDSIEADEIGGYTIPAKSGVVMSQYLMHRHPAYWEQPQTFNPQRFAEGNTYSRWVYFPFGGGPRLCIGNNFALMEAQLILATLASHFYPQLVEGQQVELFPAVTLRPRHGIQVQLEVI